MISNSLSKKRLIKYDKMKKKCQIYKNFTSTNLNNSNLATFNTNLQKKPSERNNIPSKYTIENNKNKNNKNKSIPNFIFEILKPKKQDFKKDISEEKIDEIINNIQFRIIELDNGNFIINSNDSFELDINKEKQTFSQFNDKIFKNKSEKNITKKTFIPLIENKNNSLKTINIPLFLNNKTIGSIINKKNDIQINKEPRILDLKLKKKYQETQKIQKINLNDLENLSSSHSNLNTSTGLTNITKVNRKETNKKKTMTIMNKTYRKTSQSPKYSNNKILEEIFKKINKKN